MIDRQTIKDHKYDKLYMDIAVRVSEMSIDIKHKVGALIVKDGIIAEGWNGAPTGFDNQTRDEFGQTHPWVIHAEQNAIAKCANKGVSCKDATMYITLAPCRHCARLILQAGISRVVFKKSFSDKEGLLLLEKAGIIVDQFIRQSIVTR
jgi:dCMP deaminase